MGYYIPSCLDLNQADGMSEILFHSQAAPRIEAIAKKLVGSKIETMDDYIANAEPDKLENLVAEAGKSQRLLMRRNIN